MYEQCKPQMQVSFLFQWTIRVCHQITRWNLLIPSHLTQRAASKHKKLYWNFRRHLSIWRTM